MAPAPSGFRLGALLLLCWFGTLATSRAQWTGQDIGTVAIAGSASSDSGTVTIRGSGADIWGPSDAFYFYSQLFSGDVTLTVRITGLTDTNGWAKAGLMIRETLAPNAANVFVAVTPEWHGIVTQQRSTTGSETTSADAAAANQPYWLRLTRSGSTITVTLSPDGLTWTTVRSYTTGMNGAVYAGLALTSHNNAALGTATFDNLSASTPETSAPPPSAPVGVTATATSSSQITLSWTNTSNVQNQIAIERAADGVTFQQIATVAGTATGYVSSGLNASSTYYYRLRGINNAGFGPASNIATATTSAAPPSGASWQSLDIGTGTPGQTTQSSAAVTLTGSGRDIWNEADGFRYYYQPTTIGDCEIIVRVASVQDTNGWAKAGIMLRESLDPNSAQAWVSVSAEHGTSFQWRATTGGDTQSTAPSEDGTAPRWLKLVFKEAGTDEPIPRRVLSFVSRDGANWTAVQTAYLNNTWRYIGLAVTSHNDGALCTAQFDNFTLFTTPPAPSGLQVAHRGPGGEITLAWTYNVNGIDRFEAQSNPQTAGNHTWTSLGSTPGGARQITFNIGDGNTREIRMSAFRDLVQSPYASAGYVRATVTPELSIPDSTGNFVHIHIHEPQFGLSGPQSGPWSIERSSDAVSFVEIARVQTTSGWDTDYMDTTVPPGEIRQYRVRQLLSNGDSSGYSAAITGRAAPPSGPPAAPSNLSASALSPTSVRLNWTDNSSDEEYFEIGRSTDNTTYYGLGTAAANATTFTDSTASPGTFYYYRIAAFKAGVGASSNIATVTTPSSPSSGSGSNWISADIGGAASGSTSASMSGDAIMVSGSGSDVWGGADSFRFAYQALNGAGTLTARVASITNTNGWAKAGLMIRDSATAGARNMFLAATPDWHGIVGQHRDNAGGTTAQVNGPAVTPPYWLRISRNSDYIQFFTSPDGLSWTEFFTWPASLISPNALIGFAVTSHADGTVCTATFDHVTLATAGSGDGTPTSPPSAPGGLTANPEPFTRIGLRWSDNSTNESGFQIERATSATGPFALLASPAANTTEYLDAAVAASTTYYYRIRALNGAGSSSYSNVASATTAAGDSWTSADVGNVGTNGSDSASGSTITINGGGSDIWGNADAFRFVSRAWTGDGIVEARVASMANTNDWAKAGVMIREGNTAGARNVFVAVTPSWHGAVAQARTSTGDATTQVAGPAMIAPAWVRIARTGNTFRVSISADGANWTSVATWDIAMNATLNFGFAVTAHDSSQLNRAVFEEPYVGAP